MAVAHPVSLAHILYFNLSQVLTTALIENALKIALTVTLLVECSCMETPFAINALLAAILIQLVEIVRYANQIVMSVLIIPECVPSANQVIISLQCQQEKQFAYLSPQLDYV